MWQYEHQKKEKNMEFEVVDEDQFRLEPSYDAALGKKQIKIFHNLAKFMLHYVHTRKFLER